MRKLDDLPMADPGRETSAKELFPLELSPDEYAAREEHHWLCFSFDEYRYADPEMERWVHRLGDILFQREGAPLLDELRARYLTDEERRRIAEERAAAAADP